MTKVISKKSSKSCQRGKKNMWWVAYHKIDVTRDEYSTWCDVNM